MSAASLEKLHPVKYDLRASANRDFKSSVKHSLDFVLLCDFIIVCDYGVNLKSFNWVKKNIFVSLIIFLKIGSPNEDLLRTQGEYPRCRALSLPTYPRPLRMQSQNICVDQYLLRVTH